LSRDEPKDMGTGRSGPWMGEPARSFHSLSCSAVSRLRMPSIVGTDLETRRRALSPDAAVELISRIWVRLNSSSMPRMRSRCAWVSFKPSTTSGSRKALRPSAWSPIWRRRRRCDGVRIASISASLSRASSSPLEPKNSPGEPRGGAESRAFVVQVFVQSRSYSRRTAVYYGRAGVDRAASAGRGE
jgi:hypothetical protein